MNTLRRITRHAAKAVAAGAVMTVAALPLIGITAAGAAGPYPVPSNSYLIANATGGDSVPATFGAGFSGSGTVVLSSGDATTLSGSSVASLAAMVHGSTTASSAVTFTSGSITTNGSNAETIGTTVSASATAATGYYDLAVTAGGATITINDAFYVATAPTITSMTPTTLTVNQNGVAASVTGTGFESGASVTLESSTGATLTNTLAYANSTTLSGTISAGASGTYYVTVTNPDGGSATSTTVSVTVTGPTITSFSPSAIGYSSASGATNVTTVTVNGTGFQAGGYVTISETGASNATAGATTIASATQLTFPLTVSSAATGQVTVTVRNPDGGTASSSPGTIGINQNSASATPTVTSVTPALTLAVGGSAQLTITGTGFGLAGSGDTVAFNSNAGTPDASVVCNPSSVVSDTTISCLVNVNSGAISGAHSVTVTSAGNTSAALANALTVAGPTITAVSPATVPAGFTGTYTLTGTGFPTTATNVPTTVSTTGDQVAAGKNVNVTSSALAGVGDAVTSTATGIPASTTIASIGTGTVGLSAATTQWLVSGTLTFKSAQTATATSSTSVLAATPWTYTVPNPTQVAVGQTVTRGGTAFTGTVTVTAVGATTVTVSSTAAETPTATDALTFTGTTTGSQTASAVVNVASTTGIAAGASVSGTGIAPNSTVLSVGTGTVTLNHATSNPVAASTALGFTNVASASSYYATVHSYNASGASNSAETSTTSSVTSATSMTVQGLALTGVAGGMYVITVYFSTGTVNVAVPEVVAPVISGISYASSSITSVGAGATGQTVYVSGSGFLSGATASFPSASGLSATVKSVTPNLITLSVSATSAATSAPVTVTNASGGSVTSSMNVVVGPAPTMTTTAASPGSVVAGATATTITLTGTGFVSGATVTSSSNLLTITAVTFVNSTTITFSASGPAINGTVNVGLTLTVTNPNGGTASTPFSINPQPTVTGSYYVPTFSTNYEIAVTGTGFASSGMTVTSSNADYTVTLAAVNSAGTQATLLVTTTSNATAGTSSKVTFTNPDGSTVSFTLNGGPAPTPVVKTLTAKRVIGYALTGRTRTLTILGTGFYGQPRVTSNVGGVRVGVLHDSGTALTCRVTTSAKTPRGIHTFTIRLANGKAVSLRYNQR